MTELPIVVNMTVDTSRTDYDLTAESNLEEIELLNDTVIETGGSHVPVYQGPYTVDAGLTAVTLDTDGKRMTQDVTVNALQQMTLSAPTISVNSSNGQITASVNYTPGYNDMYVVAPTMTPLSTQARATITPTASEQTAVAKGKYTTGVVKVRAISSPYADVSGVTATASDVLSGKYFVNSSGVLTLGTATAGGGDGAPMPVETVAEMIDTTKVYLYVGSEAGYTFGNWYYYNGAAWVSGGKWGADGGVNTNARNLLQYILDRATYTEPNMDIYIEALYEALAQAGAVTTTYTITNALLHITNSNSAGGADSGDSYTATLTAEAGYAIDTVTITMGGVDITSTAYNSGTGAISIASVSGDIVITASAVSTVVTGWLYRFNDSLLSSGTKDFGFTGTAEYTTGINGKAYYHHIGTEGTSSTDPLGIKATGLTDVPDLSGDFTISYWFKATTALRGHPYCNNKCVSTSTSNATAIGGNASNIKSGYSVSKTTVTKKAAGMTLSFASQIFEIRFTAENDTKGCVYKVTFPNTLDTTQWHHYAVTRGSGTVTFFIDGEIIFTATLSNTLDFTSQIAVGNLFSTNSIGDTSLTATGYGDIVDDLYIAETCKWTTTFDPTQITY